MSTSSNSLHVLPLASDPLLLRRCRQRTPWRRCLLTSPLQAVVDLARVQPGMHLRLLLLYQREA
eukprot:4977404-Pyramimonas_sp.AAC.1